MTAYRTSVVLQEGRRSIVSRAVRASDGRPVIVKQLRGLYPTSDEIVSLRRELDVTRRAAAPGVIEVYEIVEDDGVVALLLEDFGGSSLASQLAGTRVGLREFVDLAMAMGSALALLHERSIIHKDLNPSNVVRNPQTGEVKLIDFGIASVIPRESVDAFEDTLTRGTPAYMSPEQTGRMNVPLDYRTDLYSLGVTLYELLTGSVPFFASDPIELVHAHLARTPRSPHECDAAVPEVLSDMVMRLLQKRAQDRYQSATGLLFDLECIRDSLARDGSIRPLELGTRDRQATLAIPHALYGRRRDVAQLLGAFQRVAAGATEVLLVSGYSGIGKTSLVNEVQRPIAECGGLFASGKCDQFNHGVPYESLTQAFRKIVQQAALGSEAERAKLRSRILEAVRGNGRVATDLVVGLEELIGPQPPLELVSSAESENRLKRTMRQFVRAISGDGRPLVVFLDDLQWIDIASLRLVTSLATDPDTRHFLFIGAYRNTEVSETHPVAQVIGELRDSNTLVRELELGPLLFDDVAKLLADTTRRPEQEVISLAEVCVTKTHGNPFFMSRWIGSLLDHGLLHFDHPSSSWCWDTESIRSLSVADDVVGFLCAGLHNLEHETREALQFASVIGGQFELLPLATILSRDPRRVQRALRVALDADLIRPDASQYWESVDGDVPNFSFRFAHDRVQQAAYSLLPDAARRETHLSLGLSLMALADFEERQERLFDTVEHLHEARNLITDEKLRHEVSRLNFLAGQRSLASAAYSHAHRFFLRAGEMSGSDSWSRAYEYALDVGVASAHTAYLCGEWSRMDQLIDDTLLHARTPLDISRIQEVRIRALVGRQDLNAAIDLALHTLEGLGHPLAASPTEADVERGLIATLTRFGSLTPRDVLALPYSDDPKVQAAMELEVLISAAAFLARPLLLPLLAFDLVTTTAESGVSRQSPYGFGLFGLFLAAINQCDVAFRQGELSLALLDRYGDRALRPRPSHLVYGFTNIWSVPLRETLAAEREVWTTGIDTGDIEYACWGIQLHLTNSFWAGVGLDHLRAEYAIYVPACLELKQEAVVHVMVQIRQAIENLTGHAPDPARLSGPDFDEDEAIRSYQAINYRGGVAVTYALSTKIRFIFGDYAGAAHAAAEGAKFGDGVAATFMLVSFRFYGALATLQLCAEEDGATLETMLALVAEHREALATWSKFCPANHAHRVALIDAERARVLGDVVTAIDKYDEAIALSRASEFIHHEAMACELAGRFYAKRERRIVARSYLMEARAAYQRWGAVAKVAALETEFPGLRAVAVTGASNSSLTTTLDLGGGEAPDVAMDVQSLFRSTAALASEMNLDALLDQVLAVAMQNAGATRGYLVLDVDHTLRVAVSANVDGHALCPKDARLDQLDGLPIDSMNLVFSSGEPLVVDDTRTVPGLFSSENTQRGSILCVPVAYQGQRIGLIYMENFLATGVFTTKRLMVMKILATQAAVAIVNARLFEETRSMASSFERFVPKEFLQPMGRERVVDLVLGDAVTHQVTAMFVDLRGFTAIFETLDTRTGYRLLIEYFGRISPIIARHQGIVIQFLGDGIMAAFMGAADKAVDAIIEIVHSLKAMNMAEDFPGAGSLQIGAGLHAGPAMLATIGSKDRIDVTAVGDTVNCASRIEAATKTLGAPTLISEEVMWRMLKPEAYDFRDLGKVLVHGRKEPIGLVEVFDADLPHVREAKRETLQTFRSALRSYRAGRYDEAMRGFEACVTRCPEDSVAAMLQVRAQQKGAGGTDRPAKGEVDLV